MKDLWNHAWNDCMSTLLSEAGIFVEDILYTGMIYLWCLHVLYFCKDFSYLGRDLPFWEDPLPRWKKEFSFLLIKNTVNSSE